MGCSSKKTKELKDVIQASQEESEKYSSEIDNLRNQIEELILQKKEVRLAARRDCSETVAYDAFAQNLEKKLERSRKKHQNSRKVSNHHARSLLPVVDELVSRPSISQKKAAQHSSTSPVENASKLTVRKK